RHGDNDRGERPQRDDQSQRFDVDVAGPPVQLQHERNPEVDAVSRAIALARREEGIAMLMVVFLAALLLVLGVGMMEVIKNETTRSSNALVSETAFQAAEAGVDDYIAKLLDNNVYYSQY